MPLILDNDDVRRALDLRLCLAACEEAYRELAAGGAVNRPTTQAYLAHPRPRSSYCFKSVEGGVAKLGVMALRITSDVVTEQEVKGQLRLDKLPLAQGRYVGLVLLFDVRTGELLAILPDGLVQQVRVALTSALGVRCLARADAASLGLIGTGGQARAHARVLPLVRPIARVRVYSPNPEHRLAFADEMSAELGIEVRAAESAHEAIHGCDVVCTATNASLPLVTGDDLAPGVHYNAIREFELDESVFAKSDVVAIHTRFGGAHHYLPPGTTEDPPGLRREQPRDWERFPEIGDLLVGRAPGRTDPRQVSFFLNNVGTGVQFAAVGSAVYKRAVEMGLGRGAPADWFLQDIKP